MGLIKIAIPPATTDHCRPVQYVANRPILHLSAIFPTVPLSRTVRNAAQASIGYLATKPADPFKSL